MAKARIGQRIRPVGGREIDVRQTFQRIREGGGAPGAPGVTLSDDDAVRVWRAQWSVKTNDFTMTVPVIRVPPGWAFSILSMNVYAYAAYGGCGTTEPVSSYYVLKTEDRSSLPVDTIVAWGKDGGFPCTAPVGSGTNYSVYFYWFQHPGSAGVVTVATTGLTIGGNSIKFYATVPFLVNPSMSRPMEIHLYGKYGCTGTTYPGGNFLAYGTYWLSDLRYDATGDLSEWEYFDPPFSSTGSCPSFPVI